jgi:hypothetical protein
MQEVVLLVAGLGRDKAMLSIVNQLSDEPATIKFIFIVAAAAANSNQNPLTAAEVFN